MNTAIRICETCKKYTLEQTCLCSAPSRPAIPPKYSPDDRHGHLIRQAKEEERKHKGLL